MTTPTRIKNKGREADPVLVVGSVAYDSIITPHDEDGIGFAALMLDTGGSGHEKRSGRSSRRR